MFRVEDTCRYGSRQVCLLMLVPAGAAGSDACGPYRHSIMAICRTIDLLTPGGLEWKQIANFAVRAGGAGWTAAAPCGPAAAVQPVQDPSRREDADSRVQSGETDSWKHPGLYAFYQISSSHVVDFRWETERHAGGEGPPGGSPEPKRSRSETTQS